MKKFILLIAIMVMAFSVHAQNVGIGTNFPNPAALLHIDLGTSTSKGVLITGTYNASSTVPDLGAGSRMMFYPGKAAFRAGIVTGIQWDNASIGFYSTAMGYSTTASGNYSTAMGQNTTASGGSSTAMGHITTASGATSTAMGYTTTASGYFSTAMGDFTTASGDYSFAAGTNVSTNGHAGAFFLGDSDPYGIGVRYISINDQFAARFNGGYYLISSNAGSDIGVQVSPGGNSWSVISDVRLKENFLPVNGESFLQNISKMNLTTWNYKSQDAKTFRHYGPMAQDFFKAFGKDDLGIIGCDTLINQQDFLGVNLIAIKALEKRTETLNTENEKLAKEVNALKSRLDKLEKLMVNK